MVHTGLRILARTLLTIPPHELWEHLTGEFTLIFDNNVEIETNCFEVCFSRYFWVYHNHYPETPILPEHHVSSMLLKNGILTASTHIRMLERIYWDVAKLYKLTTPVLRDDLTKLTYMVFNDLYNGLIRNAEEYYISIDYLSFAEISRLPEIKAIKANLQPTPSSINDAVEQVKDVIFNHPSLRYSPLRLLIKAGIVNFDQAMQIIALRGYVSEPDGTMLPKPILKGYIDGLRDPVDRAIESAMLRKSQIFQTKPLEDSEYFARRLQLLIMTIERIHFEDCGTTHLSTWTVLPPKEEQGIVTYKGDLVNMTGVYYLDERDGKQKPIQDSDKHLIGKTIKIRSPENCRHNDRHGVCSVCFGDNAHAYMPGDNTGHMTAANFTQVISQMMLSIKHKDSSKATDPLILSTTQAEYFTTGSDHHGYYLRQEYIYPGSKLIFLASEVEGINDISLVEPDYIEPATVSDISVVGIQTMFYSKPIINDIPLTKDKRNAVFSRELIQYLSEHGWTLTGNKQIIVDISEWDNTKPILKMPDMEFSFQQLSIMVMDVIESRMKDEKERTAEGAFSVYLRDLFTLVNRKLNINYSLLSTIMTALLIRSSQNYNLTRSWENQGRLGIAAKAIQSRSMSSALAYEDQPSLMLNPTSFFGDNRPDSVFDSFIDPHGYVMHNYPDKPWRNYELVK